jgi:Ca-activated chloride channel homolog
VCDSLFSLEMQPSDAVPRQCLKRTSGAPMVKDSMQTLLAVVLTVLMIAAPAAWTPALWAQDQQTPPPDQTPDSKKTPPPDPKVANPPNPNDLPDPDELMPPDARQKPADQPADQPAPQPGQSAPAPGPGGANPPQGQKHVQAPISVTTTNVLVPVTVKDSAGNIVGDLRKEDFRLFQDGTEVPIGFFSSDAYPLSAVILLDNDLSTKPAEQVQKSIESISAAFGPNDEAAIMAYDEYPNMLQDFTFNNDALFAKLKHTTIGSSMAVDDEGPMTSGPVINGQSQETGVHPRWHGREATKCLDDAVYAAAKALAPRGRNRRKIIFLVADGTNSRHNKVAFETVVQLLLKSDILVYTISVGNALLKHETSRLVKYPSETGGDSYFASKERDLDRVYSTLTEEARNEYTIAFVPKPNKTPEGYHPIEVRIERPGLHVLAREGYFDQSLQP